MFQKVAAAESIKDDPGQNEVANRKLKINQPVMTYSGAA